jgi:hypothetical protein
MGGTWSDNSYFYISVTEMAIQFELQLATWYFCVIEILMLQIHAFWNGNRSALYAILTVVGGDRWYCNCIWQSSWIGWVTKRYFAEIVNQSINTTMSRTINHHQRWLWFFSCLFLVVNLSEDLYSLCW